MSVDSYEIVENPDKKYYELMLKEIVRTDGWSRLSGEYDIWKESKEKFWFWIAFEKSTSIPIGIITLALDKSQSHDPCDDLHTLGTFFIKEAHRKKGAGKVLMAKCLQKTGEKNVALNAALVTEEYFRIKYSFTYSPSYLHSVAIVKLRDFKTERQVAKTFVKRVDEVDFAKIDEYDKKICSLERGKCLKRWLLDQESVARVALDSSGSVIGIACLRPQIADRVTVGPLYAETEDRARDLLLSCLQNYFPKSQDTELWIRYPDPNEESIKRVLSQIIAGKYETKVHGKSMFTQKIKLFSALTLNWNERPVSRACSENGALFLLVQVANTGASRPGDIEPEPPVAFPNPTSWDILKINEAANQTRAYSPPPREVCGRDHCPSLSSRSSHW